MEYQPGHAGNCDNQTYGWGELEIAVLQRPLTQVSDRTMLTQAAQAFTEQAPPPANDMPALPLLPDAWMYTEGQWLVQLVGQVLTAAHVGVAIFRSKAGVLKPIAESGLLPDERWQWWSRVQQTPLGAPLATAVLTQLRAGELVRREFSPLSVPSGSAPHALLIAPLRQGSQLLGIMVAELDPEQAATDTVVSLMTALAKLAAQALQGENLLRAWPKLERKAAISAASNSQLGGFLSQTCHELKTPLTTIKASVQLAERQLTRLQQAPPSDKVIGDSLEKLHQLLDLTNRHIVLEDYLVNDLLEVGRIQTGKLEMHPSRCDLAALVREVTAGQQLTWQARDIRLDVPPEEMPVVADPQRLMQVLGNYLTNALKYSADDRPVQVRLQREDERVRVAVSDFGQGLPRQELKRIWERFYRVKGVKVQNGTGGSLGLGLYICRAIIQRLQGKVGVESTPGQGSTFWFTLPLAMTSDAEPLHI